MEALDFLEHGLKTTAWDCGTDLMKLIYFSIY